MSKILWLDDLRNPFIDLEGKVPKEDGVIEWVLNYEQFVQWIEKFGLPNIISFDHDLGLVEKWLPINDFEGLYEVSDFGRIKSLPRNTTSGGLLKPNKSESGLVVTLRNNGHSLRTTIHNLVGLHFLPRIEKKTLTQINHKDGNRFNNNISNLEWVTPSENVKHSHDNLDRFYTAYGENHKNSKSISKYSKFGEYLATYGSVHEASRQEYISYSNIAKCARGQRITSGGYIWKYDDKPITIISKIEFIPKSEKKYIDRFFIPDYQEKTGMDCAKWLIDYCIDNNCELPKFYVHSANPVGADNIRGILNNYLKYNK